MAKKGLRFDVVDWLLVAAIACLSAFLLGELSWPAIEIWQNRPRPGVQVCQRFVIKSDQENPGTAASAGINYLLYLPREYHKDKKWPLVVFLHGAGERGQDLDIVRRVSIPKLMEIGRHFPFILASPQCPANYGWEPERIVQLIDYIEKAFSVDPDRVYLTGFSMGGFGMWDTACRYPERFAAIAPLCGGGDVSRAERLKDLPVWAFHGAKDETVPLESSRNMVDAVRKCGGQVEFTIYPEAEHGISEMAYAKPELYEWMLAQRRGQPSTTQSRQGKGMQ